jgi:hypothetical protein
MCPERTWPDCGATLLADAPRGLCPECLMGAALSRTSKGESAATGGFEPAGQGVLAIIAQSIGPVPRVLLRDTAPADSAQDDSGTPSPFSAARGPEVQLIRNRPNSQIYLTI